MNETPKKPTLCLGEALIDVITRQPDEEHGKNITEHVGGSPLNVACGLAQLDHPTLMASWWGKDRRGQMIEKYLNASGVEVVEGSNHAEKTPIADAKVDAAGQATYEFDLDWQVPPLPQPEEIGHLHIGSFSATLEPGASAVLNAAIAMAEKGTVSYDPNARPSIMGSPNEVLKHIEQLIGLSDLVKSSDEDIAWLWGSEVPIENVMRHWLELGAGMVVVTRGPWGSYAMCAGDRDMLVVDPLDIEVEDTVGAGDSFMAGLISGLLDTGFLGSIDAKHKLREAQLSDLRAALHRAVITSGITVNNVGAYSPSRDEVHQTLESNPML